MLPEAGQGALALQVRAGEEHLVASVDDAETRRRVEAERRCVALVGGGCLAPVAAHHDGATLTALVAADDGSWIERRSGADPAAAGGRARRLRTRVRIVVTRPLGQEADLVARLEALGHEVVHCPLIEIEPLGDEPIAVSGYDWVVVTSANGARELLRRAAGPLPRVAAIGRATAARWAGPTWCRGCRPRRGSWRSCRALPDASCSPAPRERGRLLVEELDADFVPLYRTRELRPAEPPEGDLVRARLRLRRACLRTARAATCPAVCIGPETGKAARAVGCRRRRRGGHPRHRGARGRGRPGRPVARAQLVDSTRRCSSASSRTSGCRTTSSAPATA